MERAPERPARETGKVVRGPDPGVPGALAAAGRHLAGQLPVERMDRLWVFPPVRRGRKERGLLVASVLLPDDPARRGVVTVRYTAGETGKGGVQVDPVFRDEGAAPPEFLPRIIEGVVRRSEMEGGHPREILLEGDPDRFTTWLADEERGAGQEWEP